MLITASPSWCPRSFRSLAHFPRTCGAEDCRPSTSCTARVWSRRAAARHQDASLGQQVPVEEQSLLQVGGPGLHQSCVKDHPLRHGGQSRETAWSGAAPARLAPMHLGSAADHLGAVSLLGRGPSLWTPFSAEFLRSSASRIFALRSSFRWRQPWFLLGLAVRIVRPHPRT